MKNRILCMLAIICAVILALRFTGWQSGGHDESVPSSEALEALHKNPEPREVSAEQPEATVGSSPHKEHRETKTQERNVPKSPETRERKIRLGLRHNPDSTIEECLEILRQDPTNYHALSHISLAYVKSDRSRDALIYAARALEVRNDKPTRELLAKIYEAQGKPDQAKRVRQAPNDSLGSGE